MALLPYLHCLHGIHPLLPTGSDLSYLLLETVQTIDSEQEIIVLYTLDVHPLLQVVESYRFVGKPFYEHCEIVELG